MLKFVPTLGGQHADDAWQLYHDCFADLDALAVQRHLMYRDEFDQVMTDPRIDKVLILDDAGALAGLATFTNHLDAVPLIAPAYFRRRWPDAYARRAIWYIGFVAITERQTEAFTEMLAEFYRIASAESGIVGLDVCSYNAETRHLPRVIELLVRRHSNGRSKAEAADTQTFWLYDLTGVHL